MIEDLKPLFGKFANFAKNRMGFKYPPKLFLKQDAENSKSCLGRTAHYDPNEEAVTIFMTGRHPKDILRSFAHELVHHTQNLRGDLSPEKCGEMGDKYAQENPHMRKMEEEAYLVGNMCFRDWEDSEKFSLQESKILKENKTMTNKITKESLKDMIRNVLKEKLNEGVPVEDEELGPGGAGIAGDEEEAMDSEYESTLSPEDAQSGWGAGPSSPVPLEGLDAQELVQVMRGALNILDQDESLHGSSQAVSAHQDEELEEIRVGGNVAEDKEEGAECDAVEEASESNQVTSSTGDNEDSLEEGISDCGCTDLDGTPEREKNLYEARFSKRNTNLYEDLVKKWTK